MAVGLASFAQVIALSWPVAALLAVPTSSVRSHDAAPAVADFSCTTVSIKHLTAKMLADFMDGRNEPGVTLAVYMPLRFSAPVSVATGLGDYERGIPIRPESRMLAGSIGKTLYAAAALRLADAGKLALDRPIAAYLPDAGLANANIVTTEMLLSHTSGYPEYDERFIRDLIAEPLRERTLTDWTGPLRRGKPGNPGAFRYSDINFVILAAVIEAVSGQTAEAYIEGQLLRPYRLSSTSASNRAVLKDLAPGYAGPKNFFGRDQMMKAGTLVYNPQFESGGGGFATNASDLSRWIALFSLGNFFSKASLDRALSPVPASTRDKRSYGLGIHIDGTPLGTAYGHSGYIPGYYSWARWYPSANIAVAIQTNTSDDARFPKDGYDLADAVAQRLNLLCST